MYFFGAIYRRIAKIAGTAIFGRTRKMDDDQNLSEGRDSGRSGILEWTNNGQSKNKYENMD